MANRTIYVSPTDRATLKAFLASAVPKKFFALDERVSHYDFNYSYQEVYDYADTLLRSEEPDLHHNFLGMDAISINKEFRKVLDVLSRRDPELREFCDKLSKAIVVIERRAKYE